VEADDIGGYTGYVTVDLTTLIVQAYKIRLDPTPWVWFYGQLTPLPTAPWSCNGITYTIANQLTDCSATTLPNGFPVGPGNSFIEGTGGTAVITL
jgi:hypothetical protein